MIEVVVRESSPGMLTQEVRAGGHVFVADEPASVGGDDLGPTPYDLLLAALGADTSMTARLFADRRDWPLETVTVTLRHSMIYAADCADCADCETNEGLLDRIERTVEFEGDLSDDQRARLLDIVNRSPVYRTLTSEIVIHTRAAH